MNTIFYVISRFQQTPLLPVNPLLANGQITTRLRINLAGVQPTDAQPAAPSFLSSDSSINQDATIGTHFVSGQFSPVERYTSQQLVGRQLQQDPADHSAGSTFKFPSVGSAPTSYSSISELSNVQYLDGIDSHSLYKRNDKSKTKVIKRETDKKYNKRALVTLTDGSVIDDRVIASNPFDFDGLAQFGAPAFQEELNKQMDIEDEIKHHDREPAEGEVQAVLSLCSSCEQEPFQGAIIFAWKDVKLRTKNVLKGKSLGGCGHF